MATEFDEYLSAFAHEQLPDGRRRVVRNGCLPERRVLTGIGAVDVQVPKARSRSGAPESFRSSLVPPYVRRSASVDAAVPWLYLHGGVDRQVMRAPPRRRWPWQPWWARRWPADCRRTW